MATLIQLTGRASSGKTTSLRNLDSKETFYIDCDGKHLSWAGSKSSYNAANRNYVRESNMDKIKSYIAHIVKTRTDIKVIVVDTVSAVLTDFIESQRSSKSWEKWTDVASDAYELFRFCSRQVPPNGIDDVFVVFCFHSESFKSADPVTGIETVSLRTKFPSLATTKKELGSFLNYNLYSYIDNEAENIEDKYYFKTQSNGLDEARSTMGVLPLRMPNNLAEVIRLIREKDLGLPVETVLAPTT